MNTKTLTRTAMMTAVIAVLAPLSIPLAGEVPISLATFAVMLAGVLLGPKEGTVCAALYLLLGGIGVPVFAGYSSGFGILFGVTGGFLFGYIPLAFLSGLLSRILMKDGSFTWQGMALAMVAGTIVLYVLGVVWFLVVTKLSLSAALAACVIPFLPGDALKIVIVCLIVPRLAKVISKF